MSAAALLLAATALAFLYAVTLPGDDGECSVFQRRPHGRLTSSLSRRWRRPHGSQRRDVDLWSEFYETENQR